MTDRAYNIMTGSVLGFIVIILIVLLTMEVTTTDKLRAHDAAHLKQIEQACLLANANAQANLMMLAPTHPQRTDALLLLTRDAAWAPLCAKTQAAGERLRDEILEAVSKLDPGDVRPLAQQLVDVLKR